jgi:hypothetical protein
MALQKQGFDILFGQGLDTKTDPNQVPAGKMLLLENSQFNNGLLEKRNGFPVLTQLPDANQTTLTTLNNNLLATGTNLYAYSAQTDQWLDRGIVQPVGLGVTPLVRTSTSQINVDSAMTESGLICLVYDDSDGNAYYQISDSLTGQVIVQQTALPNTATLPRVFQLGRYFIITFLVDVAAVINLRYIAIPVTQPNNPAAAVSISAQVSGLDAGYDGVVANNNLYMAWNSNDVGDSVKLRILTSTLIQSSVVTLATEEADLMSVVADTTGSTPVIWIAYWAASDNDAYVAAFNQNLLTVLAPTQILNNIEIAEITSVASDDMVTCYYQVVNEYSYDTIRTDYIEKNTVTEAGSVGTASIVKRSVGLGSKAFSNSLGTHYMLSSFGGDFQPSYFLLDGSGNVLMRLAYSNGAGYASNQILPSVTISDDQAKFCYLIKDLLVSVNKSQGAANTAGIFSQTGVNLAVVDINTNQQQSVETAGSLHLTGGQVWQYDTIKPVELGFHVWPEELAVSTDTSGGFLTAQQYYYIACYEWTDAQGMLHRSAPSIPLGQVTTGSTSVNTISIPTLRLTAKDEPNPVRIVLYRWSTAQQTYYQITSIANPLLNDTSVDSVEYDDSVADADILGNTLLYTTGGVIENIAPPAASDIALTKSRAFLLDAENPNVIWFSKTLQQGVPVEFSDLLTIYIPPSTGAQGSTGPTKCITVMDDKLIAFKANAINYVTGKGPDDTGANNDFSEPTFITSVAGCSNPNSIAFIPQGIMFQSDKGIWLLDRGLGTTYIGADVERYNDIAVTSTVNVPGTNQVRFNLADGTMLMYDYFYNQWGTFDGVAGISSTLHNGYHTFLDSFGKVKQQSPDSYMDGSSPVLQKFTTAWLKINQLQGFQRAYSFSFLGKYYSPHKLLVEIAYDFDPAIKQSLIIEPDNYGNVFGGQSLYGGGENYGGLSSVEQWEVYLERQKTMAVQITITELYDSSYGTAPGAGFSMSGLNMVIGNKDTAPKIPASRSAG